MKRLKAASVGIVTMVVILSAIRLSPQSKQQSVAEVVKHSSDAVVQIVVTDSMGKEYALGSGFLISADGKIVTNHHVIKGAHAATVKLANGASFSVVGVMAVNPKEDLAIIKVAGKNLPFLSLADVETLNVGDRVVAIGSSLGLEGSVSDGIVSALREVRSGSTWIQTTAPASHGNSGGPLLDLNGNVVGVVTLVIDPGVGQNLNFAMPANEVKALISSTHEPVHLGSAKNEEVTPTIDTDSSSSNTSLWTSITTGRDYKLRRAGEFMYSEWENMPIQLKGTSAFSRGEFKKGADGIWRGTNRSYLPCQYRNNWTGQYVTNWCRQESKIEVIKISESRIEGVAESWQKFDCRKCEPQGKMEEPFTLIPKG